jgi:hypothetical protein
MPKTLFPDLFLITMDKDGSLASYLGILGRTRHWNPSSMRML